MANGPGNDAGGARRHRSRARSSGAARPGARRGRRWPWLLGLALAGAAAAGGAALYVLQEAGITPRALAPYIARRAEGHNATIVDATRLAAQALMRLDRGEPPLLRPALRSTVGAQAVPPAGMAGAEILVASTEEALRAIAAAVPGQTITFLPGKYRFDKSITVNRPGSAGAPVTVRARQVDTALLDFYGEQGFKVAAPYWRFENLTIHGRCRVHQDCEHAFHVAGSGHHFAAINNTLVDFNAHFKINGSDGEFPDHGLIEANTIRNDSVRATLNPVTPIDIVAASHWIIRRNLISDFIKGDGDHVSYGAFVKGAGSHNLMAQNIVICEDKLRGERGQRVGLSLGGGGTGKPYCRDRKCITEQSDSTLRDNLITACSDEGIYINSAARSKLAHNTLLDTAGISVRFAESSATLEGNLVDGPIRSRNGGLLHLGDNRQTSVTRLYFGGHPQRELFRDALALDFGWRTPADRRPAMAEPAGPDLCGAARPAQPRYGAFEDFSACQAGAPALGAR